MGSPDLHQLWQNLHKRQAFPRPAPYPPVKNIILISRLEAQYCTGAVMSVDAV